MTRISSAEHETVEQLRYALDVPASVYRGPERRSEPRFEFPQIVLIRVPQATAEVLDAEAAARNISTFGLACLHHPFVYPDSDTVVTLTTLDGHSVEVPARVLQCRYVGHGFHSTSVRFHERVDLKRFIVVPGA